MVIEVLFFSFIVPFGDEDGVCFASIMKTYLDALETDQVNSKPDGPLFLSGRSGGKGTPSRFVNSAVGINQMASIGKDVAKYLNLPEAQEYSTKSFFVW